MIIETEVNGKTCKEGCLRQRGVGENPSDVHAPPLSIRAKQRASPTAPHGFCSACENAAPDIPLIDNPRI